jgi:8-oxo-dGTP pyrophosphatase MutT (NUDIX family)
MKPKIQKRRRGTAIVETNQGIIIVSGKREEFYLLPGGGAEPYESRRQAAIRELEEETGLKATSTIYLFTHIGGTYQYKNKFFKNHHKVFLIKANGIPESRNEIKYIKYYNPGDQTKLSKSTNAILEKYLSNKKE